MEVIGIIIVTFIGGMGAGLGTGFAGMSAAAVIAPMLITFLKMDAYLAVGIALASDVLASAASAYTYGKKGNVDIKNGVVMLISVLIFTVIGSVAASNIDSSTMGNFSTVMTLLLGINFLVKSFQKEKPIEKKPELSQRTRNLQSILCGALVGLICGFVGAGGGLMMLLILTAVLNYDLKVAVGTSVFIMAFTAFTGAVSHFVIGGIPPILPLVLSMLFTLMWARIAAKFANVAPPHILQRATGSVLVILGLVIIIANTII